MKFRILVFLLCVIWVLTGCGSGAAPSSGDLAGAVTFQDHLGQTVSVAPQEVVAVCSGSLADAWVLAGGTLTAVTEDYFRLPDPVDAVSLGSLTAPDLEALVAQDVDVVFLSANIAKHVALKPELEALGLKTAYFQVETFQDYAWLMGLFTDITGRKDLYSRHVDQVQKDIDRQLQRTDGSAPRVLFLRSYSSGIKAKGSDSMTGQMLRDLGCINIADTDSAFSGDLSLEAILMADPDYIFATTMGNDEAALELLTRTFEENPLWNSLTAVQQGHYYLLDKELFQNKPNDRWAESYKILADILYGGTKG